MLAQKPSEAICLLSFYTYAMHTSSMYRDEFTHIVHSMVQEVKCCARRKS